MQALWLEDRQLRLRTDVPQPEPAAGEALVRVVRSGICNTDLELRRGYYPYAGIPGHEFCGIVEAGPDCWVGKRVVGEINASCGNCTACRGGMKRHCPQRTVLGIVERHGAFAEFLALPVDNLHELPDSISDDAATFIEPLAAALEIQQQIRIDHSHRVVVIGDGKLGQLVSRTLALTDCNLQVLGRHDNKLQPLAKLGIRTGKAAALELHTADVVVECTGNPDGFALALQAVRPRGTIVLKSTYAGPLSLNAADIVVNELTVVGSRCGPFAPALQLLTEARVDVSPLIARHFPLAQAIEAFDHAAQPGILKVLVDIG